MVCFITDIGFCNGVTSAIEKRKTEGKGKKLYLLHPLMHNEIENGKLRKELNATLLDGDFSDFEFTNNALLVFSAHGTEEHKKERAKEKGIPYLETTCPIINSRLEQLFIHLGGCKIFYLGKPTHPETISFLENNPEAIYLQSENDIPLPKPKTNKAVLFTQSTLPTEQIEKAKKRITAKGYFLSYKSSPCPVYEHRLTEALENLKGREIPFTYAVLGDKSSSNTNGLFDGIKEKYPDSDGFILSSQKDIVKEKRQGRDLFLACSTSISRESALEIYTALVKLG